tara:strand:- start:2588 stop:3142 length:555 start_codon:yes stop_codon:yes gene_type:complete
VSKLFLRHGEVENKKDIFYGDLTGYELSKKGHEQAKSAAKYIFNNFDIKYIYSSPLLRARQTAEPLSKLLKININYTSNLTEWAGTNIWKGKTFKEFSQTEEYKQYLDDPLKIKSSEESYYEVYERVQNIYEKTTNSIFVSHQDTIRSFTFYKLKEESFKINKPEHCGIHEIINNELIVYTYPA